MALRVRAARTKARCWARRLRRRDGVGVVRGHHGGDVDAVVDCLDGLQQAGRSAAQIITDDHR